MIRTSRILALCMAAVLAVAACGGTTTPSQTTAAASSGSSASAPSSPTSSASVSAAPVTATIGVGFPTPADVSHLPTLLAIDQMNAAGWHITPTFFSAPEVDTAALASGQVQFALGASTSAFSAIQAGAKIHLIGTEQGTAWNVVTASAITKCDDMVGKVWALNSPGGSTTSYATYWIQNNCTADSQTKIKPIYISGSQNRAAAMIAGQVDATLLTPFDIVNLDEQAPGKFHTLADFGSDPSLKDYKSSTFAVNDDYAQTHPEVVVAFLKGLLKAYGDASKDLTLLAAPAQENNLTYDANTQKAIGLGFTGGVYDTALSLSDESVTFTVQFAQKYGNIKPGLTIDQVANLTFLQQASAP